MGSGQTIVKGLTAPFFLTWADATQASILVPEREGFLAFQPAGPLLMGIGFIPFRQGHYHRRDDSRTGRTTVDPTYFYQVKKTPFGGALPLSSCGFKFGI
jgi:hypothetical protein